MPMLDAFIPQGALDPEAEKKLLSRLTDLLLEHEGADPTNEAVRSIAWVFVHRPQVYVAGSEADAPALPVHLLGAGGPVRRLAP